MTTVSDSLHPTDESDLHRLLSAARPASEPAPHGYSGFGSRLLADVVDSAVLVPLGILLWWALSFSKPAMFVFLLPLNFSGVAYDVIMHASGGQTLGKMAAKIRVVRLSGERIAWREAALRSSVGAAFCLIGTAAQAIAMTRLSDSNWGHGWLTLSHRLQAAEPTWGRWSDTAVQIWFWSELLVLLSNRKRRALHDFIAGTVVIKTGKGGRALRERSG
jgi:uncharacterized RDD family membrane protein YckC